MLKTNSVRKTLTRLQEQNKGSVLINSIKILDEAMQCENYINSSKLEAIWEIAFAVFL